MDCSYEQKRKTGLDEKNLKNRRLMNVSEIVKIDLEVFNNLCKMLKSKDNDDVNIAIENIKNLNPDEIVVKLMLKNTAHSGRKELISLLGQTIWSYSDLTMTELYSSIKNPKEPLDNLENIKIIYESLVLEHFRHLTQEYDFIDSKFKIKW